MALLSLEPSMRLVSKTVKAFALRSYKLWDHVVDAVEFPGLLPRL